MWKTNMIVEKKQQPQQPTANLYCKSCFTSIHITNETIYQRNSSPKSQCHFAPEKSTYSHKSVVFSVYFFSVQHYLRKCSNRALSLIILYIYIYIYTFCVRGCERSVKNGHNRENDITFTT